jgi:hypothetical protein
VLTAYEGRHTSEKENLTMGIKKSGKKTRRFIGGCTLGAVAMVIVVVALLLGGPDMEPKLKAQFDTAEAAYRAGKFTEAEAAYLKARELAPENPLILARLGEIALWNNRPEDAERYFGEALRNTPWYENFWPLNTQLKYRLASANYRQDHFAQASQYFREAAGPVSLGPFRELNTFSQHTALFANETPYSIEGPEQSRVDFVVTDPLPVVQVSINGSEPLYFFIDTGGAEVILDKKVAEQLGAEMAGAFSATYGGQKTAETGLGRVDSLQIGDYVVRNIPIFTLNITDSVSPIFNGLEIKGVIGTRLLMHFLSTLDYANGTLILRRVSPENLQNLETQISANGAKVIPFWLIDMHYIMAQGTVNNQAPTLFFVDTGLAGKGFTAPEHFLQAAGITVDWTKATEGPGGGGKVKATDIVVERLTLGTGANEIVENNVPGVAIENSAPVLGDQLGFRVGGLISHQFFRKYAITFDFTGMRLIIQ